MNAWLAVIPLPSASPHSFPYTVQNPDTGENIRLENIDDIWQTIETFQKNRFIFAELICDTRLLIDDNAQDDLERYFYSKEWGVSPYPGSYDEQPAKWVEKVKIIQNAIAEAQKVKAARDGTRR